MITPQDREIIERAKQTGCKIPALSRQPTEYWLSVAKEWLAEQDEHPAHNVWACFCGRLLDADPDGLPIPALRNYASDAIALKRLAQIAGWNSIDEYIVAVVRGDVQITSKPPKLGPDPEDGDLYSGLVA